MNFDRTFTPLDALICIFILPFLLIGFCISKAIEWIVKKVW